MANSTLSSSLPGGTLPYIATAFSIPAQSAMYSLPSTTFLVGYVVGPLVFAPLSEQYGRRPIMIFTFLLFLGFSLGCTLAPTFGALVTFRLFAGMGSGCSISVIGGVYADIYQDPRSRGRGTVQYTIVWSSLSLKSLYPFYLLRRIVDYYTNHHGANPLWICFAPRLALVVWARNYHCGNYLRPHSFPPRNLCAHNPGRGSPKTAEAMFTIMQSSYRPV